MQGTTFLLLIFIKFLFLRISVQSFFLQTGFSKVEHFKIHFNKNNSLKVQKNVQFQKQLFNFTLIKVQI